MNTFIRLLSIEEASSVYKHHLKRDFPMDEVKPWKSIRRMWEKDCYFTVGLFEDPGAEGNASLRGYAFFVERPDCDACLLDYYAILPDFRDRGLGGRFLLRLSELCRDRGKYILLETEDLDRARTEKQHQERMRRDSFYAGNGCVKTDVKNHIVTVDYAVWHLGGPDDFDQCCADMQALYRLMIPGEKNTRFVKIERKKNS